MCVSCVKEEAIHVEAMMVDLVQAATRLCVPYGKAYRMVLTGALKGERQDGRWLVYREDLDRLLKERKDDRAPAPA